MLAPTEIGTYGHAKLWFGSKPVDETFVWDAEMCACQQYAMEHELGDFHKFPDLCLIDSIASRLVWDKPSAARIAKFSDLANAL